MDLSFDQSSRGERLTLTGTVVAGVEVNCVLLQGYQLVGGPRPVLRPGAAVRVTGQVRRNLATTGQQGVPFVVEQAEALP